MRSSASVANCDDDGEEFLPRVAACALIPGAPAEATLRAWEARGWAPPHYLIGGRSLYRRADVLAWVASRRRDEDGPSGPFFLLDQRESGAARELGRFDDVHEGEAALGALRAAGSATARLDIATAVPR